MWHLLFSWNGLVLCISLVFSFVLFRRKRSGSSDKAQSEDSDKYVPSQLNKDDDGIDKESVEQDVKTTPSLAQKEDESVPKEEEEEREASEVEEEAEIVQQVKDHNRINHSSKASDDVLPNTLNREVEHEDEKAPEVIPVEGVCQSEDVFVSKIVEKINNSVSEEVLSGQAETESINTGLNASQDNCQAEKVDDSALSNAVDDILDALDDILAKEKTGNTASEIRTINITELSTKPVATEKVNAAALQADTEQLPSASKIPEIVITEPVIESCERNEVIEQEASINDNVNTGENSVNIELNESVEINESESVAEHEIQEAPSSVPTQHSGKRRSLVMVEKFSEKLSTSVIDAVLHRPDDDDDYPGINDSENNLWKFSEILADSIVKTVLDYSKHGDENSNFSMHVECLEYDDTNQEDTEPENDVPTEDDTCSIEEMEDEPPFAGLNDYAKRLSEQILTNVLNEQNELERQCNEPESLSAEVYISRLAENIISNAISRVNGCTDSKSTEELLDTMVTELVQNVLQSAMTKMEDHVGCKGNQGAQRNGHVDNLDHSVVLMNGKLQSKWLSEDDLDELYDGDISDEEWNNEDDSSVNNVEHSGADAANDVPNGLENGANAAPSFLRPHNNSLKQEEKSKWRSSLIEDLDEDLEFEEEDSLCEESPTKSLTFDDSGSESSDEDTKEEVKTPTAKVPGGPAKPSTSCRSRVRSVDSTPTLVFDNGSGFLKVGYSSDSVPRQIIPSVVGMPLRYSQDISGIEYSSRPGLVFGEIALGKAGVLHNDYPLRADVIEKWSDVEGLWGYVLNDVMNVPEHPECPILLTQPALNAKKNTEKLAEIVFEKFHFPSLFIASEPALALYSMGYTSGVSFCSGFSRSQAAVVYEGHVLPHTVRVLDIAGYQLTETLKKLLMSGQGFGFRSSSQWKIVDDIKRKMAFVSTDFQADVKRYKSQAELHEPYELPDGQIIEIGVERCGCAETLFRPTELGLTQLPAHMLIADAVQSCDEELQEMCYKATCISGGTTLMKGFPERLEKELHEADRKFKNLVVPEHRELSTWLGGSIMASLPTFREMVVGVDEYADAGVRVVHSKCF